MNKTAPPPINLLLLTTELRPGGAEKCLVNLACGLNPDRFRLIVVSISPQPRPEEAKLVRKLNAHKIPIHFLNCQSKLGILNAIGKLRTLIRENEVDIVQSFLVHANVLAGLALRKFPDVIFHTGIRVADPSRWRHRLEKWATAKAKKMICVSESVRQFAEQEMGLDDQKLIAIPNGIEPPEVDPTFQPESQEIQSPYALFVGRLEPQKGILSFLNSVRQLKIAEPDFQIVIAGDGSQKEEIEKTLAQLDFRCQLVGWQSSPQNLIAHAEVVFLPSLWEGMPNALLEAMALGKPVVAFQVDGIRELVGDDPTQLVLPGDYQSFVAKLTNFVTDKTLASETGKRNFERVRKNFSMEKMIASYESIYLGRPDSPN